MRRALPIVCGAAFLGCILAANFVTSRYGTSPVGFGLTATAGTYFAGATFVLRDTVQDALGKRTVLALIVLGALLSYALAVTWFAADAKFLPPGVTPVSVAIASGVAFLASEAADFAVYTPMRRRGYVRAAVASNVVGALVDTFLFLRIAGFDITSQVVAGQMVGKLAVTAAAVLTVVGARAVLRQPVRA